MSNWKEYKLDELVEITSSKRIMRSEYQENGIPFFRSKEIIELNSGNEITTELFISKERFLEIKNKFGTPSYGDILLTSVGTLGVPYFVNYKEEFYFKDGNLTWFRKFNNILRSKYLYYWFASPVGRKALKKITIGSTQPALTITGLKSLTIHLPTLEEQDYIIEILDHLSCKIQLNTQINQTLEQIAKALFKSWFVDFDPVRAKVQALSDGLSLEQAELAAMQAISGKTPEELTALSQTQPERYAELAETAKAFPCEMVEVDGVEVPKGWEVKELGSLMTIKRGGSPRPIKDFISDKGLNWVKISDATAEDNPFLFSTKEYIKSEGLSKTVLLNKGSLILSNSATPGLPRFLELDACIHDGWLYFSDIKSLTQEYLYFFFLNIRNDLVAQGNGSVFTNLKTDIVKAQKAIVPDERVICYFDKQVKSIMNLIRYNTANSISLKETRDLLLPKLLNGGV